MYFQKLLSFGAFFLLFTTASSPAFDCAYLSAREPDGWACELKRGVWECRPSERAAAESIAIFAVAALASDQKNVPTLSEFIAFRAGQFLGAPFQRRPANVPAGSAAKNEPSARQIGNLTWKAFTHPLSDPPFGATLEMISTVIHPEPGQGTSSLEVAVAIAGTDEALREWRGPWERMRDTVRPKSLPFAY